MTRVYSLLVVLSCCLLLIADARATFEMLNPPVQRGIALGLYSKDPNWSYEGLLKEMKAVGATHVSLAIPWYMKTAEDVEIFAHPVYTVPMRTVVRAIQDAKRLGFEVFLFPILVVEDSSKGWRGKLKPRDVDQFFNNYKTFVLRFAKLAADMALPIYSVGSELATMEVYEEQWLDIIAAVRQVYHGKLVYSSNWDNYKNTPFVGALDYAGVTGYFELAKEDEDPTVADLVQAWQSTFRDLVGWAEAQHKSLLITEVGYLSQRGTAAWPWKEGAKASVDLEIQRRCYEAFRRVWNGEPRFEGCYFWQWYGDGGKNSDEYTPRNKPAEEEIAKWYLGGPARGNPDDAAR